MGLPSAARAVITGAGSGLGRALAMELARPGARLIVADIDEAGAAETVARVSGRGAEAVAIRCDVRDADAVEALAGEADARFGGTDLVVNNAGVAVVGDIGEVSLEDWRFIVDVNLWGVIHGCRSFAPRMREAGGGHILNVASAAGLLAPPNMAPYNVTKAAVVALSESLNTDLRSSGVGVTVLCPTFFRTNLMSTSRGANDDRMKLVGKLMDRSRVQAPEVARSAIAAMRANRLYAVPMADGLLAWRVKRATPENFTRVMHRIERVMARRKG